MCIVCKCGATGEQFLTAFALAQWHMQEATHAMLRCAAPGVASREQAQAYARTQKRMKRLCRAWNQIEHTREQPDSSREHTQGAL